MSKTGTGAGTASERAFRRRPREHDGSLPAALAAEGRKAVLVTNRSAQWLPWSMPQVSDRANELQVPGDWDDRSGTHWTPDLVHCRLVEAGRVLRRLPFTDAPAGFGAPWARYVPAPVARSAPSSWEVDMCWWTIDQLMPLELTNRVISFGFMLTLSTRKIEKLLKSGEFPGTVGVSKTRVADRYGKVRAQLAGRWNGATVPIDRGTFELRQSMLDRGFK